MPTEYPPIMLIFFAGAILGFTLMAALITNSACKADEKKNNDKKHNNSLSQKDK